MKAIPSRNETTEITTGHVSSTVEETERGGGRGQRLEVTCTLDKAHFFIFPDFSVFLGFGGTR